MKIIISPAKKMKVDTDTVAFYGLPCFLSQAKEIREWLKSLGLEELKTLWKCNDKIASDNFERLQQYDLNRNLTPALLAYEGIQYQYKAPAVFEDEMLTYVQENLRILSGLYGVLKPMDGVIPYRLEMQAKKAPDGRKNLYEYWGDKLYHEVVDESRMIINLASKEYYSCIEKYLQQEDIFLTCTFAEMVNGKAVQKGTYAKMARGEMVRFMAEKKVEKPEDVKLFDRLDYCFSSELSSEREYVFLRNNSSGKE